MIRLIWLCCWTPFAVAGGADRGLLGIAGDAEIVIGVKAERALATTLGQAVLRDLALPGGQWDRTLDAAGVDLKRDVREIVVAAEGQSRRDALVLVRGEFDRARIRAAAVSRGFRREDRQDADLFTSAVLERDGQAFAVAGPRLALLGPPARIRKGLDRWRQAAPPPAALLDRVREVEDGDVWFVSRAPVSSLARIAPDRNTAAAARGDLFRAIEHWDASVRLGSKVRVQGHARARSQEDASSITEAMNFLMGLLQMQGGTGAGLAGAVEAFAASSMGPKVTVSFQIPQETLESALARALPRLDRPLSR